MSKELLRRFGEMCTGLRSCGLIVVVLVSSGFLSSVVNAQDTTLAFASASQSTTGYGGVANRAIDGNVNGVWRNRSVTHTNNSTQPWWTGDLGRVTNVSEIQLWNRTDRCCTSRLSDFYILVSETPFTTANLTANLNNSAIWSSYRESLAGNSVSVPVGVTGRYIRIQLQGVNALSLAEVVVTGSEVTANPNPNPDTLVPAQVAQSSTSHGGVPARAVDGNTDGRWGNRSVTHTSNELQPWWNADLGLLADIDQIEIWNRTGCCTTRLSNFYVLVSKTPFTSSSLQASLNSASWSSFHTGLTGSSLRVPAGVTGRYIRIQLQGQNPLSLAEVIISGTPSDDGGNGGSGDVLTANPDTATTVVNTSVTIDILDNDTIPGGRSSVTIDTNVSPQATAGWLKVDQAAGTITYNPYNGRGAGTDQFGYMLRGDGPSNPTTVSVTITPTPPPAGCEFAGTANQTFSLLLIGNSLMNEIEAKLRELLVCKGYTTDFATNNPGGSFLSQHNSEFPLTTSLIAEGYDLTLIQEQSRGITANNSPPYEVISQLEAKIEAAGSVMGFYQTWGRQNRDPVETESILSGYEDVAEFFGAPIVRIGRAWDLFYTSNNESPPFSLYVDYAHPSQHGKALISYVLYAYLTGDSPVGLPSLTLDEDDALLLQMVAWESHRSS